MKPTFPATYSTLCPSALATLIEDCYGVTNVQCRFISRGVGDTYQVDTKENRFILRVYRSSHRTLLQIEEEVRILLRLKQAKVSVSFPISSISGESILKINAIEGERHAVLFSYANGHVVRAMNKAQLHNLGVEIARFHNESSQIANSKQRWNFDIETTITTPLKLLKPAFEGNIEDYAWLLKMCNEVITKLSQLNTTPIPQGYCHFDFLPKNFHFDNDRVTLFDFDFMGYGWLVNDIMTFWVHLMLDVFTKRMTQEEANEAYQVFLNGYREHRSVSEQELAMIPYLSFGFWLFYMGFHSTHDQFIVLSQAAQVKGYIGILRHTAETHFDM